MRTALLPLALLVAAACAPPSAGERACNDDDDCGAAQQCASGVCRAVVEPAHPSADGGAAPDGGVDGGGPPALDGGLLAGDAGEPDDDAGGSGLDGGGALDDAGGDDGGDDGGRPLDAGGAGGDGGGGGGGGDGGGGGGDGGDELDAGPDGGADSGPGPPLAPCGSLAALADDFDDGARAWFWNASFLDDEMTRSEGAGVLTFGLANGVAGSQYSAYRTALYLPLAGQPVSVEAVAVPNAATWAQMFLGLVVESGDRVSVMYSGGRLFLERRIDGAYSSVELVDYDAAVHRFWRILPADTDGLLLLQTSMSGLGGWTTIGSVVDAQFTGPVRVELTAGTWQAETNPGLAVFDHLNGGVASASFCSAAELGDVFDTVDARLWVESASGGCSFDVYDTDARFSCPTGASSAGAALKTRAPWDWRGVFFPLFVPMAPQHAQGGFGYAKLDIYENDDKIEAYENAAGVTFRRRVAGEESDVAFVSTTAGEGRPIRWRFRHAGGQVCFDVRYNDVDPWVDVGCTSDDPFESYLSHAELSFGYWAWAPLQSDASFRVESVNP